MEAAAGPEELASDSWSGREGSWTVYPRWERWAGAPRGAKGLCGGVARWAVLAILRRALDSVVLLLLLS